MSAHGGQGKKRNSPIWAVIRAVSYLLVVYLFLVATTNVIGLINPNLFESLGPYALCLSEFVTLSLSIIVMAIFLRRDGNQFLTDMGFKNAKKAIVEVPLGLVLGATVVGIMFGAMFLVGGYSVSGMSWTINFVPALLLYFFAAFAEELVFRGFIFQTLEKSAGTIFAVVGSSLAFGFAHMVNMPTDAQPLYVAYACALLAFEAGLPLSGAFLLGRRLWLPIGFHWAWNFLEGTVFGVTVSGTDPGPSFLTSRTQGNQFTSGGIFGPEASLPFFGVGVVSGLILLYVTYKRGNWRGRPARS